MRVRSRRGCCIVRDVGRECFVCLCFVLVAVCLFVVRESLQHIGDDNTRRERLSPIAPSCLFG